MPLFFSQIGRKGQPTRFPHSDARENRSSKKSAPPSPSLGPTEKDPDRSPPVHTRGQIVGRPLQPFLGGGFKPFLFLLPPPSSANGTHRSLGVAENRLKGLRARPMKISPGWDGGRSGRQKPRGRRGLVSFSAGQASAFPSPLGGFPGGGAEM